jgi:hypothetical protein
MSASACLSGRRAEDFVAPGVRIVYVEVSRGDVEVADDDGFVVCASEVVDVGGNGVQPAQFVVVFFVAHRFAVRDVEVEDAHVADGRCNRPRLISLG